MPNLRSQKWDEVEEGIDLDKAVNKMGSTVFRHNRQNHAIEEGLRRKGYATLPLVERMYI